MADTGILAGIEAEIAAALAGIPDVTVYPTMSLADLVKKQGIRKPALGIIYTGSSYQEAYAISSRRFRATTKWRIAVAFLNLRGAPAGRVDSYALLEAVRDRIHFKFSTAPLKAAFRFEREELPEATDGICVAFVDFELDVLFGN